MDIYIFYYLLGWVFWKLATKVMAVTFKLFFAVEFITLASGGLGMIINMLCLCFVTLYGHSGLCYLTCEAQPIMADP